MPESDARAVPGRHVWTVSVREVERLTLSDGRTVKRSDDTVVHVASSPERAVDFLRRHPDAHRGRNWVFVVCKEPVDAELASPEVVGRFSPSGESLERLGDLHEAVRAMLGS